MRAKQYQGKHFSFSYPPEFSLSEEGSTVILKSAARPWLTLEFAFHANYRGDIFSAYEERYQKQANRLGASVRLERMHMSFGGRIAEAVHARLEKGEQVIIAETTLLERDNDYFAASIEATEVAATENPRSEEAFKVRKEILDTWQMK